MTFRKDGGNLINWKSKNIEEGLSLYVSVSPLLVDQFRKVSESKKANPENGFALFEKRYHTNFKPSKTCHLLQIVRHERTLNIECA